MLIFQISLSLSLALVGVHRVWELQVPCDIYVVMVMEKEEECQEVDKVEEKEGWSPLCLAKLNLKFGHSVGETWCCV